MVAFDEASLPDLQMASFSLGPHWPFLSFGLMPKDNIEVAINSMKSIRLCRQTSSTVRFKAVV
jgi:hypothetical protein